MYTLRTGSGRYWDIVHEMANCRAGTLHAKPKRQRDDDSTSSPTTSVSQASSEYPRNIAGSESILQPPLVGDMASNGYSFHGFDLNSFGSEYSTLTYPPDDLGPEAYDWTAQPEPFYDTSQPMNFDVNDPSVNTQHPFWTTLPTTFECVVCSSLLPCLFTSLSQSR